MKKYIKYAPIAALAALASCASSTDSDVITMLVGTYTYDAQGRLLTYVTTKVKEACQLMRLFFLDHVIVTDGGYYSYSEEGRI